MAMKTAVAAFDGTQDYVDVTWPALAGDLGITDGVTVTDGEGPVVPWFTNKTSSGARVYVSSRFIGEVSLIIYQRV